MKTNKEDVLAAAKDMFYKNGKRKGIIEFINSKGIFGEEAEQLATAAYKGVKSRIHQAVEIKEHKSHGGPLGKIAIGVFAIGIGIFGVFALERIFYIIFLFGFGFIGTGVIGLFVNPVKSKID